MKFLLILLTCFSFKTLAQEGQPLRPFVTDYCTAYPEGTIQRPDAWKHCCIEHDLYFWAGGSLDDRKNADVRLRNCVEKSGFPIQARLIYTAVSMGAESPIRFKTKEWGHAWELRLRYLSLSESETAVILQHLESHNSDLSVKLTQSFKEQLHLRLDVK